MKLNTQKININTETIQTKTETQNNLNSKRFKWHNCKSDTDAFTLKTNCRYLIINKINFSYLLAFSFAFLF